MLHWFSEAARTSASLWVLDSQIRALARYSPGLPRALGHPGQVGLLGVCVRWGGGCLPSPVSWHVVWAQLALHSLAPGFSCRLPPEMTSWQVGPPVRVEGRWEARGVLRPSLSPAWMGPAQAGQGGCMREGVGLLSFVLNKDPSLAPCSTHPLSVASLQHLDSLCRLSASCQTPQSKGLWPPRKKVR